MDQSLFSRIRTKNNFFTNKTSYLKSQTTPTVDKPATANNKT